MINYVIILNALQNNRGSEALIRGLTSSIKKENGETNITVISSEYDIGNKTKIPDVDRFICRYNYSNNHSPKRYLSVFLEKVLHSKEMGAEIRFGHLKKLVSAADHVIVIGADNYDASYNMFDMMHQMNNFLRKYTKGKLWLYDCSIEKKHINDAVLNDMMLFDGITVRETETEEALHTSSILKKIYFFPDPAFAMQPEVYLGIPDIESTNYIGVNVSNLITSPKYGNSKDMIYENYRCLVNYCINELNNKVLLIPHVMGNADLYALKAIKDFFVDDDRVVLLSDEKINAAQLKYVISKCRFIVTARTHVSIAAYSMCIPTLVLGYSVKSRGIAKDLFADIDHYVVPVQKMKDKNTLVGSFKWVVEHEYEIKRQMENIMPQYIDKVFGFSRMLKSANNDNFSDTN